MHREKKAYLYALAAVLIWSTVATAFKLTLGVISKEEMLLWAFLVSSVTLGILVLATKKYHQLGLYLQRRWKTALLLGTVNPFLYYFVLFYAYDVLPAQEAQTINYTWALMLAYLSVPLLGHRLQKWDSIAGLICYLGVLIIATHGKLFSLEFGHAFGVTMALLSTVLWALYWIYVTKISEDMLLVLFANFAVGLLWIVGYAWLFDVHMTMQPSGVIGAVYIGLFEMSLTFLLWGKAMALTSRTASIANLIFLSPILSLVFIHFIVKEEIAASTIVALLLILSGLFLQQKKAKEN